MKQQAIHSKEQLSHLQAQNKIGIIEQAQAKTHLTNFNIGIQKMKEALTQIPEMKQVLSKEQILLKDATETTKKMLKDLQIQQRTVWDIEAEVNAVAQKCEKKAEDITRQKKEAEHQLQVVFPPQMRTESALSQLNAVFINELKVVRPPQVFKLMLDAIAIYFNLKLSPIQINPEIQIGRGLRFRFWKNSFQESGRFILGPNFDLLRNLRYFNKDAITDQTIELLQPLLEAEWCNEEICGRSSRTLLAFYRWITALYEYHRAFKIIKPKIVKIALEETKLQIAKQKLVKVQEQLTIANQNLKKIKEKIQNHLDFKNELLSRVQNVKKNIATAQKLIEPLSNQYIRQNKKEQRPLNFLGSVKSFDES